jgi:hypothetical protein
VESSPRHLTSKGPLFEASYIFEERLYKFKTNCLGLNYTPMVSVDTLSRDTIPLRLAFFDVLLLKRQLTKMFGLLNHTWKFIGSLQQNPPKYTTNLILFRRTIGIHLNKEVLRKLYKIQNRAFLPNNKPAVEKVRYLISRISGLM